MLTQHTHSLTNGMHFIDFLLQLLCFIIATIRSIYNFIDEFIVPAVVYVLPVALKCIGHLVTGFLWIFFTYVSPCIIYLLHALVQLFTHGLNGLGYVFLSVSEIDIKYVNVPAVVIGAIVIVIIYFRITDKIITFCRRGWLLAEMNVLFGVHIVRVFLKCLMYVYRRVVSIFVQSTPTKNGVKHRKRKVSPTIS